MLDAVCERLSEFGYSAGADDARRLEFLVEKVENTVLDFCNVPELPAGLYHAAVDRVAADFLLEKKAAGGLEELELEAAVKQVQEGDTSVTYAFGDGSLTPEARLDALIAGLREDFDRRLAVWRRVRW